jgi:hypothetical protein
MCANAASNGNRCAIARRDLTTAVQELLNSFDALSKPEKQEAAVEIFRRVATDEGELPESALIEAAEDLFRALDAEEAADAER